MATLPYRRENPTGVFHNHVVRGVENQELRTKFFKSVVQVDNRTTASQSVAFVSHLLDLLLSGPVVLHNCLQV